MNNAIIRFLFLFLISTTTVLQPVAIKEQVKKLFSKKKNKAYPHRIKMIYIVDYGYGNPLAQLIEAAKDVSIDGILLIVDDYGGCAGAYSVFHDTIKKIKSIKPTISLITSGACSGGYLAASAAEFVIAHSASNIGSIGVIMEVGRYKNPKINNEIESDLQVDQFYAGQYKVVTSPYRPDLSQEEKEYLQKSVDRSYAQFISQVAQNRHLSIDNYKSWAEGQLFDGPQALQLGLIDQVGTFFDAEDKMVAMIEKKFPYRSYINEIEYVP